MTEDQLEQEALGWQELPESRMSRIAVYKLDAVTKQELGWPSQFQWPADAIQPLDKAFRPRAKNYQALPAEVSAVRKA